MPSRTRKDTKRYKKHIRSLPEGSCDFCTLDKDSDQFISETKSYNIIRNIFPYTYWDLQAVEDHLLIVPKRHINSLNDFSAPEAVEYVDLIGSYESRGYNVYSRAEQTLSKSVVHQHTHLIKSSGRLKKLVFYMRRPYVRLVH